MKSDQVHPQIQLIDLEPRGIRNFAASYIVKAEKTAIIETGPKASVPNLLRHLRVNHVNPADVAYIAVSHIHLDHGGGAGTLMKELPHAELVVHRRGKPHLADPELLWTRSQEALKETAHLYGEPEPIPAERITAAGDGLILSLGGGVELKVFETVGHASHHLAFFEPASGSLFPGDAAGIYVNELDVTVPTTPAPFRLDLALASLKRLIELQPTAVYYSHFGNPQDPVAKMQGYVEQL
ncbi:MAG: MBL fold metallo-hydrolase, partial [Candidatus Bathyarchaeota archaeon]